MKNNYSHIIMENIENIISKVDKVELFVDHNKRRSTENIYTPVTTQTTLFLLDCIQGLGHLHERETEKETN